MLWAWLRPYERAEPAAEALPLSLSMSTAHQRRAVSVQATLGLGDIVGAQSFGELLSAFFQKLLVRNLYPRCPFAIDDDELEPFTAHHRAESTAACVSGCSMFHVIKDETRVSIEELTGRANPGYRHFAESLIDSVKGLLAGQT